MKTGQMNARPEGFTRTDLSAVVAGGLLLALLALPALAKRKPHSQRFYCANSLRQLGQALLMYASENDGCFPPRRYPDSWPTLLAAGYKDLRLLRCPSDGPRLPAYADFGPEFPADNAPRSYFLNGWNDYFGARYGTYNFTTLSSIMATNSIRETDFPYPAATIALGEKRNSSSHFFVDLFESLRGDAYEEVEHQRHHSSEADSAGGGSNNAFVDGSVRYLKYWQAMAPTNLWAVTDRFRTNVVAAP